MNSDGAPYYNFNFGRHILHESIVTVSLNYQTINESLFLQVSEDLAAIAIKIANEEYKDEFIANQNEAEKEVAIQLQEFSTVSEEKNQSIADCVFDKNLSIKNQHTAEIVVNEALHSQDFQDKKKYINKLSHLDGESRHSVLVVGGPASGKGSIAKLVKSDILYNDAIELNPDLYKNLILPKKMISVKYNQEPNIKLFFGSITHSESSIIFDKIAYKWSEQAKNGKAPNLLMDICRAGNWIINITASGNTSVEIYAANLDTEVALERAYERGEQTGRFVPTEFLLQGHKDQFFTLSNAMNNYNIRLNIYDTLDKTPQLSIATDEVKKELHILDAKSAVTFFSKTNIYTQANNSKALYNTSDSFQLVKNIQNFAKNYVVKFYNQSFYDYSLEYGNFYKV